MRILIAEDDDGVAFTLTALIKRVGKHEIDWAKNGREAINLFFSDNKYDFIITDYNMPEANGIVFSKSIRDVDREIPIIVFTGNHFEVNDAVEEYSIENIIVCDKTDINTLIEFLKTYDRNNNYLS